MLLPLKRLPDAHDEFKEFLRVHDKKLKEYEIFVDPEKIDATYEETKKILKKVKEFENQLANLEEGKHKERVQIYLNYIEECSDLEEENVQILYERMTAACCLNVSVWKEYVKYLENRSEDWQDESVNDSWIFHQKPLNVIDRGLRNCTWSEDLFIEKMRVIEKQNKSSEDIKKVFEEAYAVEYRSAEPQVKLWLAYLTCMARQTDFKNDNAKEQLQKTFDYSWKSLGQSWGDLADPNCEILKFWGQLEYDKNKFNNPGKGRNLWKTVLESSDNYRKSGLWIEYALLESANNMEICRTIFRRAAGNRELDNLEVLVSAWMRFERLHGNIDQLKECQDKCDKLMMAYHHSIKKKEFSSKKPVLNKRKNQDSDDIESVSPKKKFADKNGDARKPFKSDKPKPETKKLEDEPVEIDKTKDNIRVFLSNLDFNVTEDDIKDSLAQLKITNVSIVKNNIGKSRGFGYAELQTESEVSKALSLDRTMINGRPVFISKCQREKDVREKVTYANRLEMNKVFVKGLRNGVTKDELQKLFEPFGVIKDLRIVYKK